LLIAMKLSEAEMKAIQFEAAKVIRY